MFSQVDISNYGSFKGFTWRKSLQDAGNTVQNFKRLNILYGRNYSGKTTLSRIFRALETGRIPLSYVGSTFTVRGDKGDVTQTDLVGHGYDVGCTRFSRHGLKRIALPRTVPDSYSLVLNAGV